MDLHKADARFLYKGQAGTPSVKSEVGKKWYLFTQRLANTAKNFDPQ